MTKKKTLFDEDSEEEVALKTENEYAKKYDAWREKEELYKLEQKYGSKALNSDGPASSDSEDESDEPPEVSEEVEKQFLKTLSLLKTKDPRIYDPNYKFFDEKVEKEKVKEPESKTLTFGDSDDDEDDGNIFSIEKKAEIHQTEDDHKSARENSNKSDLKAYLTGAADNGDEEAELAPLRALWSDPKLNEGEAFLRDYILNKRYMEEGPGDAEQLRDDEELEQDERRVEEQGQFERAYNFRFEEPDHEFLKRFPRTMNHIRPKDTSRAQKRAEVKERKEREKQQKLEEIARMKSLKLKEIREKIARIKEVTGNEELAFREEDIEGDFDPQEHDRTMKAMFDEQYYGEVDEQKPVFPDLDEELEIENWDKYNKELDQDEDNDQGEEEPHCEDDNFNMDAEYDPKKAKENLLEALTRNMGKKRRNRKKKSKLAQLLTDEKPTFVPEVDKTYSEFMEEYYRMDCEDIIGGDLPTRFKYRPVVPNDYGLTVEEILLADDKELTQWVPLKKIVRSRPENVEKSEVNSYSQKAADVRLKKKILPSLFKELPEYVEGEPEIAVPAETNKKKKKKKKKKEQNNEEDTRVEVENEEITETSANIEKSDANGNNVLEGKRKKKKKQESEDNVTTNSEDKVKTGANTSIQENDASEDLNNKPNKKKKRKKSIISANGVIDNEDTSLTNENNNSSEKEDTLKSEHKDINTNIYHTNISTEVEPQNSRQRHKKRKKQISITIENSKEMPSRCGELQNNNNENRLKRKSETESNQTPAKRNKKNKNKFNKTKIGNKKLQKGTQNDNSNPLGKLSDERLKAYGLNPKKYRSFLKYKKF